MDVLCNDLISAIVWGFGRQDRCNLRRFAINGYIYINGLYLDEFDHDR